MHFITRSWATMYRFWRREEGVTAIEFAFVAPVLLLLILGIIEFSLVMFVANVMESATTVSARLGSTGFVTSGISRQQTIINSITAHLGNLIDPKKLTITTKSYSLYNQIGDPEPYTDTNRNGHYDAGEAYTDVNGNGQWDSDMGSAGYGGAGDVVVYTVSYPWKVVTPMIARIIAPGGIFTITTHAVVKNEPF